MSKVIVTQTISPEITAYFLQAQERNRFGLVPTAVAMALRTRSHAIAQGAVAKPIALFAVPFGRSH
ncbi:hypothetical protein [Scytonema sp. HK-05]|uniref:hypothetical protein n=1 Tax=Scytonema sp. HK-05 TaxID=1137095 RepID=UPI000A75B41F|nr:hypothetical protein [Scytonema sp. HK-05]